MLDDSPGDGEAVKGGGAAADFVEQDEAGRRGVVEDGGDLGHFYEKRRAATGEIVAGADAREDAVNDGQFGLARWHEAADLRHQDDERGLAEIGGLAAHVGASDEQKLLARRLEEKIIRDETLAALAEEFFDYRMAAGDDEEVAGGVEFGAGGGPAGREILKVGGGVPFAAMLEGRSIKSWRSISRMRSSAARILRSYSFNSGEVKRSALTRVCLRS